jgi:hypothetical protein
MLQQGAAQVLKRFPEQNSAKLIDWLYESALSRLPTTDERTIAMEILGGQPTPQGVEDLLWVVTMLPEFQIIR